MRKLGIFLLGTITALLTTVGVENNKYISLAEETNLEKIVYVGGMPAGFTLQAGYLQVVGTSEILTEQGVSCPASKAGIRSGDKIIKLNNVKIEKTSDLNDILAKIKGSEATLTLLRNGETLNIKITPVKDKNSNKYKIGVLVKDSVSGIGTVTYIDKQTGKFGALGHTVLSESNQTMTVSNSIIYKCNIVGVNKGVRGKAGELRGMFLSDNQIGTAEKLSKCGIFGQINCLYNCSNLTQAVADSNTVNPGSAYIYSTVNGIAPKKYTIEIVKVDKHNPENKNYVIKITDEALIEQTGGIVQGMSGSPIIQNDKVVGAITHVFLNDPTRGYGIDIEKMLKE